MERFTRLNCNENNGTVYHTDTIHGIRDINAAVDGGKKNDPHHEVFNAIPLLYHPAGYAVMVAKREGKIGMMRSSFIIHPQRVDYLFCPVDEFQYDTMRFFVENCEPADKAYCIATKEGRYFCFMIEADLKTVVSEIGSFDHFEECLSRIPESFRNGRVIGNFITDRISTLTHEQVFVFGSNPEGDHNGGAAEFAHEHFGAESGIAHGPSGQSYAICTTDGNYDALSSEAKTFVEYAKTHPEKDFFLTRVGCGNAGWKDDDVAPLFFECLSLSNVAIPMEWDEYREIEEEHLNKIYTVNVSGRATIDEWLGDLAVIYAAYRRYDLSFDNGMVSITGDSSDELSRDLVNRFNERKEGPGKIHQLKEIYERNRQIEREDSNLFFRMYEHFLLDELGNKCSEIQIGTASNPRRSLCSLVNRILSEHGCQKIYCPFSGTGSMSIENASNRRLKYTNQEPSSALLLISKLYKSLNRIDEQFICGDFDTDWLADGHDGLVCIPPIAYQEDKGRNLLNPGPGEKEEKLIRDRCRQTLKVLLNKICQKEHKLKAAVIFVNDDFLYSDEFFDFRRVFCENKWIEQVIALGKRCFIDVPSPCAALVLNFEGERDSALLTDCIYTADDFTPIFITDYSSRIPFSYLKENNYCFSRALYNVPNWERIDCVNPEDPTQKDDSDFVTLKEEEEIEYVPLREILKPQGESSINDGDKYCSSKCLSTNLGTILDGVPFSDDSMTSKRPGEPIKLNNGALMITHDGALLCRKSNGVVCKYSRKAVIGIVKDGYFLESLLFALYRERGGSLHYQDRNGFERMIEYLESHHTTSFSEHWSDYVLSWRIPVKKDYSKRLADNNGIIEVLRREKRQKKYNVVTIGAFDSSILGRYGLETMKEFDSTRKDFSDWARAQDTVNKVDAFIVDVTVDQGNHGYTAILNMTRYCGDKTIFLSCPSGGKEKVKDYIRDALSEVYHDFECRIFEEGELDVLCEKLRKDLETENSPEGIVKRRYQKELEEAKAVDQKYGFGKNVHDTMLELLVSFEKNEFSSFDNIRVLRDALFKRMEKDGIIPSMKPGAVPSLLLDKYYKDEDTQYIMLAQIIPNEICAGLVFLGNISNTSIHEGDAEKVMGEATIYILMSFISWFNKEYGILLQKSNGQKYYTTFDEMIYEFNSRKPYQVHMTKRGDSNYCYCGNIHLGGKNLPKEGDFVILKSPPSPEQKPLIDGDIKVFFYSKDWMICKDN